MAPQSNLHGGTESAFLSVAAFSQDLEIQRLRDLTDVVLAREDAMGMAMHDKPTIAFRIRAGLIKMMGFKGQAPHQLPMGLLDHPIGPLTRIAIMPDPITHNTYRSVHLEPAPGQQRYLPLLRPVRCSPAGWSLRALGAVLGFGCALPLLALGFGAQPARAQASLNPLDLPRSCPALLPKDQSFLEPMRLSPKEVAAKNARGCLSPGDAIYGPDGCPTKLCPQPRPFGL